MLIDLTTQSIEGIDIVNKLRHKYNGDSLFEPILKNPTQFRNFEVEEELIYLKEQRKRLLCIPKIIIEGHSAWEIIISKAHSVLAHLGASKTLDYLRDHIWWRDMVSDMAKQAKQSKAIWLTEPASHSWISVGIYWH
jgi:Integrase zinc binding domain